MQQRTEVNELQHSHAQEPNFIGLSEHSRVAYYISLLLVMLSTQLFSFQKTAGAQEESDPLGNFALLVDSLSDEELEMAIDKLQNGNVAIKGDVGEVLDFAQDVVLEELEAEQFDRKVADLMDEAGLDRNTAELIAAKELGSRTNESETALSDIPQLAPDTEWLQVQQERTTNNRLSDALRAGLTGEIENPQNAELQEQQGPATILELSKFPISAEAKAAFTASPDVRQIDDFGNHIAEYYAVPASSPSIETLSLSENGELGFMLSNTTWSAHTELVVAFQDGPDGLVFSPVLRFIDDEIAPAGTQLGLDGGTSSPERPILLSFYNDIEGLHTGVLTVSPEFLEALNHKIINPEDSEILSQLQPYDVVMIKTDDEGNLREIMTNTAVEIDGVDHFIVYQFHLQDEEPQNLAPGVTPVATAEAVTPEDLFGIAGEVGAASISAFDRVATQIENFGEGGLNITYEDGQVRVIDTDARGTVPENVMFTEEFIFRAKVVLVKKGLEKIGVFASYSEIEADLQSGESAYLEMLDNDERTAVVRLGEGTNQLAFAGGTTSFSSIIEQPWNIVRVAENFEGSTNGAAVHSTVVDSHLFVFSYREGLNDPPKYLETMPSNISTAMYADYLSVFSCLLRDMGLSKSTDADAYYTVLNQK